MVYEHSPEAEGTAPRDVYDDRPASIREEDEIIQQADGFVNCRC